MRELFVWYHLYSSDGASMQQMAHLPQADDDIPLCTLVSVHFEAMSCCCTLSIFKYYTINVPISSTSHYKLDLLCVWLFTLSLRGVLMEQKVAVDKQKMV